MAASQFKIYQSSDPGSPGFITGNSGSLIRVLDACLLYGYGSKASAGWTQSFATTASIACYTPPSGSGMTLVINENLSGSGQGNIKEVAACGWEVLTSLTSSFGSGSVGQGTGQFPVPAQNLPPIGKVILRKTTTQDITTNRPWLLFADAYTMYLFILTGDTGQLGVNNTQNWFFFGDIFSLAGASDVYKTIIVGRAAETVAGAGGGPADGSDNLSPGVNFNSALPGHFMAKTFSGAGQSLGVMKIGDTGKSAMNTSIANHVMVGAVQTPNSVDNALYLSPLHIVEIVSTNGLIRGRLRGLYHVCHPVANFTDGQTFQGANDYAGKTFRIIKGGYNGGFMAVETSNTVETN